MAIIGTQQRAIPIQPFQPPFFSFSGSCCIADTLLTVSCWPGRAPAQPLVEWAIATNTGRHKVQPERDQGDIHDPPCQDITAKEQRPGPQGQRAAKYDAQHPFGHPKVLHVALICIYHPPRRRGFSRATAVASAPHASGRASASVASTRV